MSEKLRNKVWESLIDCGLGSLLKPFQIKRESLAIALANRKKALIEAQTKKDVALIESGQYKTNDKGELIALQETEQAEELAIQNYIKNKDVQKAFNILSVVEKIDAIAVAASDEDHEYTEPDYQWFDRWRENAEHASTEDLQILWAKVLCTECKNNKSISLRTLEVLKNLNHDEAEKIELIAALNASGLIIRVIGNPLIDSDQVILPKDIPLTYFIDLEELGIISGVNELGVSYALKDFGAENESTFLIGLPKHSLHIHSNKKIEKLPINGFKITKIGNEIMQILDVDTNKQYLTNLVSVLNSKNYETYVV